MTVTQYTPENFDVVDLATLASMCGLEFLQAIARGELPSPPITKTLGFKLAEVEEGAPCSSQSPACATISDRRGVRWFTATLLDSCMACAVQSTLPKCTAYTTMEFKISLLRLLTKETGPIRAEATSLSRGRRAATAEGRLTDAQGKLLAHATTTCLIFALEGFQAKAAPRTTVRSAVLLLTSSTALRTPTGFSGKLPCFGKSITSSASPTMKFTVLSVWLLAILEHRRVQRFRVSVAV